MVVGEEDLAASLYALGQARANAGADLQETLTDVAALHAVLAFPHDNGLIGVDPDSAPAAMVRSTALGWAAQAAHADVEVRDSLTGLATMAYLRTRLRELYGDCAARNLVTGGQFELLSVHIDLFELTGWPRLSAAVLLSDVLREVFTSGESLVSLGAATAVIIARKETGNELRVRKVRKLLLDRFAVDAALRHLAAPRVSRVELPKTVDAAFALIDTVRHK
jgi:hypothetical protein